MESLLYERIRHLCLQRNISFSKLESDLGFGNATINKWKATGNPTADKLQKIAEYFNVSTDYLLGISEIPTTVNDLLKDEDLIALQRARISMSKKDREKMMKILKVGFADSFDD